ncbi:MAG: diguanylate cyclase [Anaerolineae bacterium]|nr:diguanylate cyclase [Anaerolineae bacterium]
MKQVNILKKLLYISRMMAETRDLDPLLEYAMQVGVDLVRAERGFLVLKNEDGSLDIWVGQDWKGDPIPNPERYLSHAIVQDVIATGESLLLADAMEDPGYQHNDSVMELGLKSVICVPLITRGDVMGAILVENRSARNNFEEQDLSPLEYFASQAAVSIQNVLLRRDLEGRVERRTAELEETNEQLKREIEERIQVESRLEKLASTDPLLGIYNQRYFFTLAEEVFNQSRVNQDDLSIILLDLDHFKRINDTYGHRFGDKVLHIFAEATKSMLREEDIFARYGGEEFVILLPKTNLAMATQVAERLRNKIEKTQIATNRGGDLSLTVSAGVAALDIEMTLNIDILLEKADQAMYQSKGEGRNKVTVWANGLGSLPAG